MKLEVSNFSGGGIKHRFEQWQLLTSDKFILDTVKYGLKLEFLNIKPSKHSLHQTQFNKKEQDSVTDNQPKRWYCIWCFY